MIKKRQNKLFKNSKESFWLNKVILQMRPGLFIAFATFWIRGDSLASSSLNLWLYFVPPFVLIGLTLLVYGRASLA